MQFSFATATRIVFGPGTLRSAADAAALMGSRILLVTGRNADRAAPLKTLLITAGREVRTLSIAGEPDTEVIRRAVDTARTDRIDAVVGMGGGSAIDAAKAMAALMTNPGDLSDYLEVVGQGRPLRRPPLPCIAIPTTAGTGSEVTANAVLRSSVHGVKVSLRSAEMLPRLAVVDPQLTVGLPPPVTAASGMDALTQLIEAFVSRHANPLTDGICREGMRHAASGLLRAFAQGSDLEARTAMCLASLFSGIALANAKLGAVHGLAAPLGGRLGLPHGLVCAHLLAPVMAANIDALRREDGTGDGVARFTTVARILTGDPAATAEDGVAHVRRLSRRLSLPPLSAPDATAAVIDEIAHQAVSASSMKGNPIPLPPETLAGILTSVLTTSDPGSATAGSSGQEQEA